MDRTGALAHLPETYRRLLTMLDAGVAEPGLSGALGVEASSLPTLVRIAHAKLDALITPTTGGRP